MHFIQRSNVSTTEKICFSGGSRKLRTGGPGPVALDHNDNVYNDIILNTIYKIELI